MKYLSLCICLLATIAAAQQPTIDSVLVDESRNELSVYGDFGSAPGKIWCDSVELPVTSWSYSLIIATIPPTGKGSAGPIIVGGRGHHSEPRMLSIWKASAGSVSGQNGHGSYGHSYKFDVTFRLDLHSILRGSKDVRRVFEPCYNSIYNFNESALDAGLPRSGWEIRGALKMRHDLSQHSSGFHAHIHFNASTMGLYFTIDQAKGAEKYVYKGGVPEISYIDPRGLSAGSSFDSNAQLVGFSNVKGDQSGYAGSFFDVKQSQFLPPAKAIALNQRPVIAFPKDSSSGLSSEEITLQWDSLRHMSSYHLQVSLDSITNHPGLGQTPQSQQFILDTVVSGLYVALTRLKTQTKYYWRIAGINSEGKSRWSAVSGFTTSIKGEVNPHRRDRLFTCHPNPFRSTTSIQFSLTESTEVSLFLYDMLGREVWSQRPVSYQAGSHAVAYSDYVLPPGQYVIRLLTKNIEESAIVIKY